MTIRHWLLLLLAAALFGSAFLMVKLAVAEIPPLTVAAIRILCGVAVGLVALTSLRGPRPPARRVLPPAVMLGLLVGAIPFTMISFGQQHIASGMAGIIYGAIPIFVLLIAVVALPEERLSAGRLLSMAIGLGGVVLVLGPASLTGLEGQAFGIAVTLVAAVSHASGAVVMRRAGDIPTALLTCLQFMVGAAVVLPLALILDRPWEVAPSATAVWAAAGAGITGTALPMLLMVWLVKQVGATNTSLMAFFMPVFAVGTGALAVGEWVGWTALAGLAAILVGAALASRQPRVARPAAATT